MNSYIQGIQEIEEWVASTIRENHAREFEAVDAGLEQVLRGLEDYAYRKDVPDNALEGARLFLATRSFNSLWVARQTLERGYYQQALALVRMAMEDQMVARDAENHPPTLDALFEGKGRIGRNEFALDKMAERISPEEKVGWQREYGEASAYGTHPRPESMRSLLLMEPNGQKALLPGGIGYDKGSVDAVLYYLLSGLMNVLATLARVASSIGSGWGVGTVPVYEEIASIRKKLRD